MCGLSMLRTECYTTSQLNMLLALYQEVSIRGLHAFGLAWGQPEKSLTVQRTHHLEEVLTTLREETRSYLGKPFLALGHTRYDTSGDWRVLENNQPLEWQGNLLMFNGVIRMSTQAEYEAEFGEQYPSDNDGWIIFRMALRRDNRAVHRLLDDPRVSFAGMFYLDDPEGGGFHLGLMRNERRPLWVGYTSEGGNYWAASTSDAFVRASCRAGYDLESIYELPRLQHSLRSRDEVLFL